MWKKLRANKSYLFAFNLSNCDENRFCANGGVKFDDNEVLMDPVASWRHFLQVIPFNTKIFWYKLRLVLTFHLTFYKNGGRIICLQNNLISMKLIWLIHKNQQIMLSIWEDLKNAWDNFFKFNRIKNLIFKVLRFLTKTNFINQKIKKK